MINTLYNIVSDLYVFDITQIQVDDLILLRRWYWVPFEYLLLGIVSFFLLGLFGFSYLVINGDDLQKKWEERKKKKAKEKEMERLLNEDKNTLQKK
jgi:hypothetical protein